MPVPCIRIFISVSFAESMRTLTIVSVTFAPAACHFPDIGWICPHILLCHCGFVATLFSPPTLFFLFLFMLCWPSSVFTLTLVWSAFICLFRFFLAWVAAGVHSYTFCCRRPALRLVLRDRCDFCSCARACFVVWAFLMSLGTVWGPVRATMFSFLTAFSAVFFVDLHHGRTAVFLEDRIQASIRIITCPAVSFGSAGCLLGALGFFAWMSYQGLFILFIIFNASISLSAWLKSVSILKMELPTKQIPESVHGGRICLRADLIGAPSAIIKI